MQTVTIVIHLMLVISLVGVILLQKSEGGGLGSGSPAGFMSSRGTANMLTRTTAYLAAGFFVTSLILSIMAGYERKPQSIVNPTESSPAVPTPTAPAPGGVLDQLRQNEPPAAPPAGNPSPPPAQ